jgi:hypothetical protein
MRQNGSLCAYIIFTMDIIFALLGILWVWLSFLMIPFGLPGNWLMAASALLPLGNLGYTPLIIMLGAALIAEILELIFGAKIVNKAGAGKSGIVGAFVGAFVGGIFLSFVIPVPVIGTAIGACLGAFLGAVAFEVFFSGRGQSSGDLAKIGVGASLGTLFGRITKISIGAASAIYWSIAAVIEAF